MRYWLLPLCIVCFSFIDLAAQKRKTFKINPGEKVIEKIPKEELYAYDGFTTGTIYFKNETYSVAKMNYNALYAEMQYIDPKGDTLSLGNEKMIKLITINTDTFYFSDGYHQLLYNQGDVKLGVKKYFIFLDKKKLSGFGEASGGQIETYTTMSNKSYLNELVAQEILTLAKDEVLYIGNVFNNFKPLNKKNLLEVYAKREKEVQAYLKENKTDLSKEDDVKRLMAYFKTHN